MPAVTRIGDADVTHCSGMTRAGGSSNVFCNGIGISRQGDNNTGHLLPGSPCPGHSAWPSDLASYRGPLSHGQHNVI